MIALRTLGALDLSASDGRDVRAVLRQPKRCALLVYLALAGPERFRRRDTVVALFWPESDEQHARGALRQALTFLRRELGDGIVATRGEEEIGLAPGAVSIDVREFERSCELGSNADAVANVHFPLIPAIADMRCMRTPDERLYQPSVLSGSGDSLYPFLNGGTRFTFEID